MPGPTSRHLLYPVFALLPLWPWQAGGLACPPGQQVTAFFAGSVDLGAGVEACSPEMEACYFPGRVATGPDAASMYHIDWDDGDTTNRQVHSGQVKQSPSGETCDGPAVAAAAEEEGDENWVPPEIPCTILPRLHWEGSDPEWNKEAILSLKKELEPDEVIDGFDWHVILRFNDVDKCEAAFNALNVVLSQCSESDPEKCHTHKYVKAIEYVGDDPNTRRKTGRHRYDPNAQKQRTEL